ncbi:peroxiredoxin-like family protein [Thermocrispum municipale]|jgi:peroxiredoxin|uniref:peroxiredoxin-like family protein n=1 Tax=Thermocrispum municipale TaxID=37926 RepID=UPI0004285E08|nr:peroxiredoxin-like family protein [Thermocrispum municipale]
MRPTSRSRTGTRCTPGTRVPALELTTIRADRLRVPDPDRLTHLVFRRFAACPICNVHLHSVARRHSEIVAAGVREIVVFHSSVDAMVPHQGSLPFDAVADPDRQLYRQFGVESSMRSVLDPRAWTAWIKPEAWRVGLRELRSGARQRLRDTNVLGMPAELLIAPSGTVLAAKYGSHANDQWSVDELLRLAATCRR